MSPSRSRVPRQRSPGALRAPRRAWGEQQGRAERQAGVSSDRRNVDGVEVAALRELLVHHAVHRDAAGQAQVARPAADRERLDQGEHRRLEKLLRAGGQVAVEGLEILASCAVAGPDALRAGGRRSAPGGTTVARPRSSRAGCRARASRRRLRDEAASSGPPSGGHRTRAPSPCTRPRRSRSRGAG